MKRRKIYKHRPKYYSTGKANKQFYRRMFINTFLCILIVIVIIIIKLFSTPSSDKAIKVIKSSIEEDRSIKSDVILVYNKVKEKEVLSTMFHNEDTDDKYVFPVDGVLYKDYGEYKKSNDIQVFNKGVDIIADNEAVKAISEGTVLEVGKDNIYGNYMVIKHGEYLVKYYGLGVINKEINDNVKKGEIIGEIKNTNEKLNFRIEIYKDNEAIDPIDDIEYSDEDILLI